jgi:hypothetical protein
MHINTYTYIYTYIQIHTCIPTYACTQTHINICTYIYRGYFEMACIGEYVSCICRNIHKYVFICIYIYIYMYIYIYIHIYMYTHIYRTYDKSAGGANDDYIPIKINCWPEEEVCICIHIFICIFMCVYICIGVYMYIYINIYSYMYAGERKKECFHRMFYG